MPQGTGQRNFHLSQKYPIRETFLSYEAEEVQRDANLKVWVSKYERCDTEFKHLVCIHQGDSVRPTSSSLQSSSRQGTVTLAFLFFPHLFSCHSSDADQYAYKPPTSNTPNELFTKTQQEICASWRVLTLEWLTKISTKILNTI